MLTYVSALLSGAADPFWPHVILISASVLAGVAVGSGIIFESPNYSSRVNHVATWLVISGVVVESICTVSLFVFDEGISRSQQEEIISLRQLAGPRNIHLQKYRDLIKMAAEPFRGIPYDLTIPPITNRGPFQLELLEPGSFLVEHLIVLLSRVSGWKLQSVEGDVPKTKLPAAIATLVVPSSEYESTKGFVVPLIDVGQLTGVVGVKVVLPPNDKAVDDAAFALAQALNKVQIWTDVDFPPPYNNIPTNIITGNAVHIIIGSRP